MAATLMPDSSFSYYYKVLLYTDEAETYIARVNIIGFCC
jgi:hypothetical protein